MKRVAVVQSNYLPWKGYFDLIDAVDEFVLYDDVQYTRRDWRNRNRIKSPTGTRWLTVPVETKGKYRQLIRETMIDGGDWAEQHWRLLVQSYRQSPHFERYAGGLEDLLRSEGFSRLSDLNEQVLRWACDALGIETMLTRSADYPLGGEKSERLLGICRAAGATTYVSGPAARAYLDVDLFAAAGVDVRWFDYPEYPAYEQPWGPFEHAVSIVDLLFARGPQAADDALLNRRAMR